MDYISSKAQYVTSVIFMELDQRAISKKNLRKFVVKKALGSNKGRL